MRTKLYWRGRVLNQSFSGATICICAMLMRSELEAAGTWSRLTLDAPGGVGVMLLLSDGTVMAAQCERSVAYPQGQPANSWYRLTPAIDGSYENGTWSQRAPMNYTRRFFSSALLPDGRVFVAGGEFGSGSATAEIYDPGTYDPRTQTWNDSWIEIPVPSSLLDPGQNQSFGNSLCKVLPGGDVLLAPASPSAQAGTLIYSPSTGLWSQGPSLDGSTSPIEASWIKLPDDSILTVPQNSQTSQRYLPSPINQWTSDAFVPVSLFSGVGAETGPALLLPSGKALFLGGNGSTALYTPSLSSAQGTWVPGPSIPHGLVAADSSAAVLVNGRILCAVSPALFIDNGRVEFPCCTSFYEYDYSQGPVGSFTALNVTDYSCPANQTSMLDLPDGSVLYSHLLTDLYVYQPDGSPQSSWRPTIMGLTRNLDGSYRLVGARLNGISEGAAHGDDAQMDSNYPLVRMLDENGNVHYARSYNWGSTSVQTGGAAIATDFRLPSDFENKGYSIVVVANGISSDPVPFSFKTFNPPPVVMRVAAGGGDARALFGSGRSAYLTSTIGQHDAALLTHGTFNLLGGFLGAVVSPAFLQPPVIVTQPNDLTNIVGTTATFHVVATGRLPLTYRWRKNRNNLSDGPNTFGSFTATLVLTNISQSDEATYDVIVGDPDGSIASSSVRLIVITPAFITSQPASLTNVIGSNVSFLVSASGTPPLTFQWRKDATNLLDGGNVSGATASTLVLIDISPVDAGDYTIVVTNSGGSITSASASLTVAFPATATPLLALSNVCPGTSYTFHTTVSGTGPLVYHWTFNGVEIPDATNSSLSGFTTNADVAGLYCLIVNGTWNIVTNCATLTLATAPTITDQPASQTNTPGDSATFTVASTGTQPLSYQWQKDGAIIHDGGHISGASTMFLTISNISIADAGNYQVAITNCAGSLTSSVAGLIVPLSSPPQPLLRVLTTGTNTLVLAWPTSSFIFTLDQNVSLGTTEWSAAPFSTVEINGESQVIIPATSSRMFYRLRYP